MMFLLQALVVVAVPMDKAVVEVLPKHILKYQLRKMIELLLPAVLLAMVVMELQQIQL